jgi:glycosyltransferase involved in cell wall biosynthesis
MKGRQPQQAPRADVRITYLGPVPPQRGGIAQHGARLVEALAAAGHEVHVEAWGAPYPRRLYPGDQLDASAPPLGVVSLRRDLRWWNPLGWWRAGRRARHSDLVVLPWWSTAQGPAALVALAAAGRRSPVVVMAHNVLPHDRHRGDRALTRRVLGRATAAVAHTDAVANQLCLLLPGIAVHQAPHPPNVSLPARALPPGPPWRLVMFGHVRGYKGLDLAIDTVAELRRRGVPVELTVAGQFWEPVTTWQDRLAHLQLNEIVRLQDGYVPDDELDDLFAVHHLVLAAYRSATQSGVVPLAAGAGRASVVTPVGGLADQVVNNSDGVVAGAASAEALADAVSEALANLDALTEGARTSAPTWSAVADAVLAAAGGTRLGGQDGAQASSSP